MRKLKLGLTLKELGSKIIARVLETAEWLTGDTLEWTAGDEMEW